MTTQETKMNDIENSKSLTISLKMSADDQSQIVTGIASLDDANSLIIDCAEMAQFASDERTSLARRIDRLKDARKGFLAPAQQIMDHAKAMFDPALCALEQSRGVIGGKLKVWTEAQEAKAAEASRIAANAERKARAEAEAKAAAEMARADEQAAAARRQAEEAEERRKQAEAEGNSRAAAAAAAAAASALARAESAIEAGAAKAEAVLMQAAAVAPLPVAAPTKIAGSQMRDNWVAQLKPGTSREQATRMVAAAAVGGRNDLWAHIELTDASLNKLAKALKGAMDVPGYEAYNDRQIAGARK